MLISEHYILPVVSLESHLEIFNMDIKVSTASNLLFPSLSAFRWTSYKTQRLRPKGDHCSLWKLEMTKTI